MTKWVIRAINDDGRIQTSEIETDNEIAFEALKFFEVRHGWGCWTNIDIDRAEE